MQTVTPGSPSAAEHRREKRMKTEKMIAELENFVGANWRNSYRTAAADLATYSGLDDAETAAIIALGERWDENEERFVNRMKGAKK